MVRRRQRRECRGGDDSGILLRVWGDSDPAPPTGAVLVFEFAARGVQIYACAAKPDVATACVLTLKAPEAELFNSTGDVVGRHFAGPTWQRNDGSAVVGTVLERADAPEAGSTLRLLLEAEDHARMGVVATVTYVQRFDTVGGVAPAEGGDADHAADENQVP